MRAEAEATAREALARCERELAQKPDLSPRCLHGRRRAGVPGRARAALAWAKRALAIEPDDHQTLYNVACTYSLLGLHDEAVDLLERAMPGASAHRIAWMRQDGDLEPLRDSALWPRGADATQALRDPGHRRRGLFQAHGCGRGRHAGATATARRAEIEPLFAEHGGRTIKLTGDGAIVEFASVVEAVRCAVLIQAAMSQRNAGLPEAHRISLRIAVHLGDIIGGRGGRLWRWRQRRRPPGGLGHAGWYRRLRDRARARRRQARDQVRGPGCAEPEKHRPPCARPTSCVCDRPSIRRHPAR